MRNVDDPGIGIVVCVDSVSEGLGVKSRRQSGISGNIGLSKYFGLLGKTVVEATRIVIGIVAKRNVGDPVIGDAGQIGCREKLVDDGRGSANEIRRDDVVGKRRTAGAVCIA